MKILKKVVLSLLIVVMVVPMILIMGACGDDGSSGKLISLSMSTSSLHTTKTTYYRGDSFSPSSTYVTLTYYSKEENKQWKLSYPLTSLNRAIKDVNYEVTGFDSSEVVSSQEIVIKISSPTYSNEVTTKFTVKINPEYIVESEILDETAVKNQYVLNEELDYSKLKIKNTYSNGREEIVDVTSSMVTGFDTTTVTSKKRKLKISYNEKDFDFYYVVAISADYKLLDTAYVDLFVPTAALGYSESVNGLNYTYIKSGSSTLEIGCYKKFSYTETMLKNYYLNTSGSNTKSNVDIISYEKQNINGIDATVCKYKYTGSTRVHTGIWFDRNVTLGNVTSECTVELLYYGDATTTEVYNTLITTIAK